MIHEGTRRLVGHLVEQGHSKIALINGPKNISTSQMRKQAFRETLKMYGLTVNEKLLSNLSFKQNDAGNVIDNIYSLPANERPTAIFAGNNFIAINIIKILRGRNISVPEDISMVCFDDPDPIPEFRPFLTIASQPAYDFGYLGMQLLIERIENKGPQEMRKIVLPPEILIRKSTRPI